MTKINYKCEIKLDACINVRMTSIERDELRSAAKAADLTMSEVARRRMVGRYQPPDQTQLAFVRELRAIGLHLQMHAGDDASAALETVRQLITSIGERMQ